MDVGRGLLYRLRLLILVLSSRISPPYLAPPYFLQRSRALLKLPGFVVFAPLNSAL